MKSSNRSDKSDKSDKSDTSDQTDHLLPPHGGYRKLRSFQTAELVYDGTVIFCDRFIEKRSRTHDQMVQAARSGRQNTAEGSMAAATFEEDRTQADQRSQSQPGRVVARLRGFSTPASLASMGQRLKRGFGSAQKISDQIVPTSTIRTASLKPPPKWLQTRSFV